MGALVEGPHAARVERVVLEGTDGTAVDAIHATPDVPPEIGVVLHPDLMGVRPLFDDLARRIATHGFAVCATEPFARVPPTERAELDPAGRLALVKDLDDRLQLGDLLRASDYLVDAHAVQQVCVLGFCMGGMYVLKAAACGEFARAVPFYGMIRVPDDWRGPGQRDPLDTAEQACATLAIFGGADPWTPVDDIDALRAKWAAKPECTIVVYADADHGFVHDSSRPAHRPEDAQDAWRRALEFLRGA